MSSVSEYFYWLEYAEFEENNFGSAVFDSRSKTEDNTSLFRNYIGRLEIYSDRLVT